MPSKMSRPEKVERAIALGVAGLLFNRIFVSPAAVDELKLVRLASRLKPLNTTALKQRLSYFHLTEANMWALAAAGGAASRETPYYFRWAAARYFWHGLGQRFRHVYVLCLRCGSLLAHGRRASSQPGRCTNCAKERQRAWPAHAIAPAGQGTWWLNCQHPDCTLAFEGTRRAAYCPQHKQSSTTPGRRRANVSPAAG